MATNNNPNSSMRTQTPPLQTPPGEDTTPPPHPPLEYDDPQRFLAYAHSISFDDDDFSTDDMFANPTPLSELGIPSVIQQAERLQQQQAQNYSPAPNHPHARGTGLGKPDTRPLKRVRVDTPQAGKEDAVREDQDNETGRAQRRVRFDVPKKGEGKGGDGSVRDSLEGEGVNDRGASKKETQRAGSVGDSSDSSDDCAWSVDSGVRGSEEGEKAQDINASPDHDSNAVKELEQRRVETEDSSRRS